MMTTMTMRVDFYKDGDGRLCSWVATPPHRRSFPGSTMAAGRDLPHDLMQFTIERALQIRDGFWGLLAHGGWFASVPGRRPTPQGRAIVREHYAALVAVEGVVNGHYRAWKHQETTPLKPELDVVYARWLALGESEPLTVEWPVHPLPEIGGRRSHGAQRRGVRRPHRGAAR
jgi:hypothetical protein